MALTNPLLLNPLLFSTMQGLNESGDLMKGLKGLMPNMPPAAMAMAASLPMTMWSLSQFKKPIIGDSFNGSFGEAEVTNIRNILENVNAEVTKSILEANLKKWASTCGLSSNEILEKLAHAQPLSPGQLEIDESENEALEVIEAKKAGGRPRAMISDDQVSILKAYYSLNSKPRREDLIKISEEIGHPFKVVKVWFQNTRARDRRENSNNAGAASKAFSNMLPPTPPASTSAGSQKCVSPPPLDLSTKPSTPSASPPPLVINSEAEEDTEDEIEDSEDELPAFPMTSRPPIDIEELAKQHFDNMIRAKLVTLEPTAEAMLPDAPVAEVTPKKKKAPVASTEASEVTTSSNGSGQTIYTCDQCDKTFTKKSSITRHKYEHSGKFKRERKRSAF